MDAEETAGAGLLPGAEAAEVAEEAGPGPQKADQFMCCTPLDRLLVLHSLVEWRIEACPYIREAVDRTVKDAGYGAASLREEPMALDRFGNRYVQCRPT